MRFCVEKQWVVDAGFLTSFWITNETLDGGRCGLVRAFSLCSGKVRFSWVGKAKDEQEWSGAGTAEQ